jgi:hypothetical protein
VSVAFIHKFKFKKDKKNKGEGSSLVLMPARTRSSPTHPRSTPPAMMMFFASSILESIQQQHEEEEEEEEEEGEKLRGTNKTNKPQSSSDRGWARKVTRTGPQRTWRPTTADAKHTQETQKNKFPST